MSGTHPLFHVDHLLHLSLFLSTTFGVLLHDTLWLVITLQVAPEMLEKGDFLLEFLWILSEGIFLTHVLAITGSPLHVINVVTIWVEHYFC